MVGHLLDEPAVVGDAARRVGRLEALHLVEEAPREVGEAEMRNLLLEGGDGLAAVKGNVGRVGGGVEHHVMGARLAEGLVGVGFLAALDGAVDPEPMVVYASVLGHVVVHEHLGVSVGGESGDVPHRLAVLLAEDEAVDGCAVEVGIGEADGELGPAAGLGDGAAPARAATRAAPHVGVGLSADVAHAEDDGGGLLGGVEPHPGGGGAADGGRHDVLAEGGFEGFHVVGCVIGLAAGRAVGVGSLAALDGAADPLPVVVATGRGHVVVDDHVLASVGHDGGAVPHHAAAAHLAEEDVVDGVVLEVEVDEWHAELLPRAGGRQGAGVASGAGAEAAFDAGAVVAPEDGGGRAESRGAEAEEEGARRLLGVEVDPLCEGGRGLTLVALADGGGHLGSFGELEHFGGGRGVAGCEQVLVEDGQQALGEHAAG